MARPTRQARYPALPFRGRSSKLEEHLCIREGSRQGKDNVTESRNEEPPPLRPVRVAYPLRYTLLLHGRPPSP